MQEYDDPKEYQNTLANMKDTTVFHRRFGEHQLFQNNHWSQYRFYSDSVPLPGFTFLRMAVYSCGGQTHEVAEYTHDTTGMECVLVPAGTFSMGSESKHSNEKPVHAVSLDSFIMSKHAVTQKVWKEIMGAELNIKEYFPWLGDNYPVDVNWFGAVEFCKKAAVSLPTEAQWEYACRAGTTTNYYWGDTLDGEYVICSDVHKKDEDKAEDDQDESDEWTWQDQENWNNRNSEDGNENDEHDEINCNNGNGWNVDSDDDDDEDDDDDDWDDDDWDDDDWEEDEPRYILQEVAANKPNAFGLHDMLGYTWEWCSDWYGNYTADDVVNPTGPTAGIQKILRGGDWQGHAWNVRSAFRSSVLPGFRQRGYCGFRFVLDLATIQNNETRGKSK